MAYVKDLWMTTVSLPDGGAEKTPTKRHGSGKRWLAVWVDPDGRERSAATRERRTQRIRRVRWPPMSRAATTSTLMRERFLGASWLRAG